MTIELSPEVVAENERAMAIALQAAATGAPAIGEPDTPVQQASDTMPSVPSMPSTSLELLTVLTRIATALERTADAIESFAAPDGWVYGDNGELAYKGEPTGGDAAVVPDDEEDDGALP